MGAYSHSLGKIAPAPFLSMEGLASVAWVNSPKLQQQDPMCPLAFLGREANGWSYYCDLGEFALAAPAGPSVHKGSC